MTLRFRVILIVAVAITALVSAIFWVFYGAILPSFSVLEQQELSQDLQNGVNSLQNEIDEIRYTGRDWAYWDDTYEFVQNKNEAFIRNNLKPPDLKTILVNLIVVLDNDHQIVFSRAIVFENLEEIHLPADLEAFLEKSAPIIENIDVTSGVSGVVLLEGYPVLMSIWPILDSNQLKTRRGTLIFGRYLDQNQVGEISRATSLSLDIFRIDDPYLDVDISAALDSMLMQDMRRLIITPSEDEVIGYTIVEDIFSKPAILLRIISARPLHQQARTMFYYFLTALIGLGIIFILLTIIFINRFVISRLVRLSREVVQIGDQENFERRVSVSGGDELAELGKQVNHMLSRLDHAQSRIRQRNRSLEICNKIITGMAMTETRAELLEYSLHIVIEEFGFSGGAVLGLKENDRRFTIDFEIDLSDGIKKEIDVLSFDSKPVHKVLWSGKDYWLDEGMGDDESTSSTVSVYLPVIIRDQVEAILFFFRSPGVIYDQTQRETLMVVLRELGIELERKQSEMVVKQLNKVLTQTMQAKDDFLATVSHELKMPLNAILGSSEALMDGEFSPLTEQQGQTVGTIHESVRTMMVMITNVLDLSKIQAGKLTLQRDWTMVKNLCDLSVRMVENQAQNKGIKISYSVDDPERAIWVDQRRMRQTLIILLGNAVRYTPEGGEVVLKAYNEANGDRMQFIVQDTGIGIDPEKQADLFKPFSHVNGNVTRSHTGAGLGLALADGLVRLHGGEIKLESALGKGSRFTISLPGYPGDYLVSADELDPPPHGHNR